MRTIIAGSRHIFDVGLVHRAIAECGWTITVVLCGGQRGVDTIGKEWAKANGIPVVDYPADWFRYGKPAGPIRNRQMARDAEALVLVHTDTPGSRSMLAEATAAALRIYEVIPRT